MESRIFNYVILLMFIIVSIELTFAQDVAMATPKTSNTTALPIKEKVKANTEYNVQVVDIDNDQRFEVFISNGYQETVFIQVYNEKNIIMRKCFTDHNGVSTKLRIDLSYFPKGKYKIKVSAPELGYFESKDLFVE